MAGDDARLPDWLTIFLARGRWRGQHGVAAGAADRLDVPVPLAARGFRLHGPRGLRHGPPDAGAGPAGQVVRAADRRFRLQRTVDHGRADPGRAARAADYHHDGAVHVLRRAPGDLRRIRRGLLRQKRRAGDLLPVPARHRRGDPHRAVAQAHLDARRGLAVRHGTAAVPRTAYENPVYADLAASERLCGACG